MCNMLQEKIVLTWKLRKREKDATKWRKRTFQKKFEEDERKFLFVIFGMKNNDLAPLQSIRKVWTKHFARSLELKYIVVDHVEARLLEPGRSGSYLTANIRGLFKKLSVIRIVKRKLCGGTTHNPTWTFFFLFHTEKLRPWSWMFENKLRWWYKIMCRRRRLKVFCCENKTLQRSCTYSKDISNWDLL